MCMCSTIKFQSAQADTTSVWTCTHTWTSGPLKYHKFTGNDDSFHNRTQRIFDTTLNLPVLLVNISSPNFLPKLCKQGNQNLFQNLNPSIIRAFSFLAPAQPSNNSSTYVHWQNKNLYTRTWTYEKYSYLLLADADKEEKGGLDSSFANNCASRTLRSNVSDSYFFRSLSRSACVIWAIALVWKIKYEYN